MKDNSKKQGKNKKGDSLNSDASNFNFDEGFNDNLDDLSDLSEDFNVDDDKDVAETKKQASKPSKKGTSGDKDKGDENLTTPDENAKMPKDDGIQSDSIDAGDSDINPEDEEQNPKTLSKWQQMLKKVNTGTLYYALIGVAVVVGGYLIYNIIFPSRPDKVQRIVSKQGFNFNKMKQVKHVKKIGSVQHAAKKVIPHTTNAQISKHPDTFVSTAMSQNNASAMPLSKDGYVLMSRHDMKELMHDFSNIVASNSQRVINSLEGFSTKSKDAHHKTVSETIALIEKNSEVLHKDIEAISKNFAGYNKQMLSIAKELKLTRQELKLLLARKTADKEKLTLRAVVPGRAWLVNHKGDTTSVEVGNEIKNYGKVVSIDSDHYKIYMSSGYVFS